MTEAEEAAFRPLGAWERFAEYRGALILPVDPEGRALLQLRDLRAPVHAGQWGLFGGGVEADETLLEAALREFEEETGLRLPPASLRPFVRIVSPVSRRRLYVYLARAGFAPREVRLGEGAGFAFVEPELAARLDLVPATRLVLAAWMAEAGR